MRIGMKHFLLYFNDAMATKLCFDHAQYEWLRRKDFISSTEKMLHPVVWGAEQLLDSFEIEEGTILSLSLSPYRVFALGADWR